MWPIAFGFVLPALSAGAPRCLAVAALVAGLSGPAVAEYYTPDPETTSSSSITTVITAPPIITGPDTTSSESGTPPPGSVPTVTSGTPSHGCSMGGYTYSGAGCVDNPSASIDKIAGERMRQMVQFALLSSILLSRYEQINCTQTCASMHLGTGSFSGGFHGRKYLTDRLSILGGVSFNDYKSGGVHARQALIIAMALRYDLVEWGSSRPFFEFGGSASPTERSKFRRAYTGAGTTFTGSGSARSQSYMIYGRAGWVKRVTPRDEFSVFVDLVRQWQLHKSYSETGSATNPAPASFAKGKDVVNVVRLTLQHVRLLSSRFELQVNAGVAQSFGTKSGVAATIGGVGTLRPSLKNQTWAEFSGRLGFRLSKKMVVDAFVLGSVGSKPVGTNIHGGMGLRAIF